MTYSVGGTIQATDYNNMVAKTGSRTGPLNLWWSVGTNNSGYNQRDQANVAVGQTVKAAEWNVLIANTATAALHQGTSITAVALKVVGGIVTYTSAIPTNIATIYTNRVNAASQGATSTLTTVGGAFTGTMTFTQSVSFASGDSARYFFNAGGQIKLTFAHPGGSPIDAVFSTLAGQCGTIIMSSPSGSGTAFISGVAYNGIKKVGGGGSPSVLNAGVGYYGCSSGDTTVFSQLEASSIPYTGSSISVKVRTNGTQGGNADNGSVVTFTTVWKAVLGYPGTPSPSGGSTVTMTVVAPSTSYLTNSWGTPGLSGSAA
jgi:hypothetical protein